MTDFSRIDTVKSLSPAPVTLDAIRKIVREELQANAALEAAARQALEALEQSETTVPYEGFGMARRLAERKHQTAIAALRAVLKEQA